MIFSRLYNLLNNNLELVQNVISISNNNHAKFEINEEDMLFLIETEKRNNPFAEIDYKWFEIDNSLNL